MKKLKDILFRKVEDYRDKSDVFINNEIKTNLLMSKIDIAMVSIAMIHLILTLTGVLDRSEALSYPVCILILLIQILVIVLNLITKGHWLYARYALLFSAIAAVLYCFCIFGSEITIVAALPMFLAVRYYDTKFTRVVVFITIAIAAIGMCNYYFGGGVNLNIFYLEEPGIVFDANVPIIVLGTDRATYIYRLFLYDYLFEFLILFVLACIAIYITKHGTEMIEEESKNIEENTRFNTEISLAMEIQANMLPCTYPAFPSFPDIDLFAVNYPAREMGGDFYDYLQIDDDHVAIIMADVSGKGVGAAFFMSIAKASLDFTLTEYDTVSPAEHLKLNNHYLYKNNSANLFVTCWLGIYEISTHKLTYANAGHNPPVIIRKGSKPEYLKSKPEFVLAGMDNTKYTDNVIELNKGDEIILYTDGVTEAVDSKDEQFGELRLLGEIDKVKDLSSLEQVNHINLAIKEFIKDREQFDDVTLLAMKINN